VSRAGAPRPGRGGRWVWLALAAALAGCPGRAQRPDPPPRAVAPTTDGGWRTMRAEHRVTVDVTLEDGKHDRRLLRGAIAVERPDRFRLRALGPAGITLFDLLFRHGKVTVLQAIKDPAASALGPIIEALAGDLSAAFTLEPAPAGRVVTLDATSAHIDEPERRVRLSAFTAIGGKVVPLRIEVDNRARHYTVSVEAHELALDVPLDPALFSD